MHPEQYENVMLDLGKNKIFAFDGKLSNFFA